MNKFVVERVDIYEIKESIKLSFDYIGLKIFIKDKLDSNFVFKDECLVNFSGKYFYSMKGYKEFIQKEIRNNRLDDILNDE